MQSQTFLACRMTHDLHIEVPDNMVDLFNHYLMKPLDWDLP